MLHFINRYMVITLVKKSKVEKSPHFEEIVTRLSKGESARSVSKWLKNQYNEDISHAALARYNKNHIAMEDRVEAELNRRAEEKKKLQEEKKKAQEQEAQQDKIVQQGTQQEADKIESAESTVNIVAETIANNMEGVAKVAAQFPEKFDQACYDAEDPDSNVTSKDVARLALDANKLYNDYFKNDETTVNVDLKPEVTVNLLDRMKEKRRELNDLRSD